MSQIINLYCDESCHLENDGMPVMVLGVVCCSAEKTKEIAVRVREIKAAHGLPPDFEVKWSKVSPAKRDFYRDLIDYFFDDDDLHFRGLVAPKGHLAHADFGQTHDDWYYKMMFTLFEPLLRPDARFRIYLDKKDTQSASKVRKLHDVLCNNLYDFNREIVEWVQVIQSHEVEQLQLTDLLTGAICYHRRGLAANSAKINLIERIKSRSGYGLDKSTLLREPKFNLFIWRASNHG